MGKSGWSELVPQLQRCMGCPTAVGRVPARRMGSQVPVRGFILPLPVVAGVPHVRKLAVVEVGLGALQGHRTLVGACFWATKESPN